MAWSDCLMKKLNNYTMVSNLSLCKDFSTMRHNTKLYLFFWLVFGLSSIAFANAPVVDLSQSSEQAAATTVADPSMQQQYQQTQYQPPLSTEQRVTRVEQQVSNMAQMNLPGQISELRQQVEQLQGQLEIQAHQLELLQNQQKSFYQDLTQQISQLKAGNSATSNTTGDATATTTTAPTVAIPAAPTTLATPNDQTTYQAAFTLLENKKYNRAVSALQSYLKTYPKGQYVVNAHYWLGEIYYLQNKPDMASAEFQTIVSDYPTDQKVPDALLKIAFINDNAGKHAEARTELRQIVKKYPGTSAAQLANMRLQTVK